MKPLVSVIIPVYNRESTIMRALNSVLNQTYYNLNSAKNYNEANDFRLNLP